MLVNFGKRKLKIKNHISSIAIAFSAVNFVICGSVNAEADIDKLYQAEGEIVNFAPNTNSGAGALSKRVDKKNPYSMIRKVSDITFKRFASEQSAIQKNPNLLKDIVREELVPYINYQYAAFKVIGNNFKKTNKADRAKFVPVFRDYLITSYAQVFTLYNNQEVQFSPEKDFSKEKVVAVKVAVIEPGRPPIDISFRVRKSKKTKEWKAYDMVAEGVSLLDSKQAELSSIIRQKGLAHVTEMLKEKAQKDIVFK